MATLCGVLALAGACAVAVEGVDGVTIVVPSAARGGTIAR
jgi:hypothetical protein